jgi:hypothetical protein
MDIAEILKKYTVNDFVFMKIDIEGAELEVLSHFIVTNSLKLIDYMVIEYHDDNFPHVETAQDAFNFILKSAGIKKLDWD